MSTSKRQKATREADLKKLSDNIKREKMLAPSPKFKKKAFEPLVGSKVFRRDTVEYPSNDSQTCITHKKDNDFYTGDYLVGITIVHKSCLAPVSINTDPTDYATMRR
jgi:hypothetical protein